MEDSVAGLATEGEPVLVASYPASREFLHSNVVAQRRGGGDAANQLQPVHHDAPVVRRCQIVVPDRRHDVRVGRSNVHGATRLDLSLRRRQREARERMKYSATFCRGEVDEVDLCVRARDLGPGTRECCGITSAHRERTAAVEQILQPDLSLTPAALHVIVQCDGAAAAPECPAVEVILQSVTYAGCLVYHRDSIAFE